MIEPDPFEGTVAVTEAPSTNGVPICGLSPPTTQTLSKVTGAPGSSAAFSAVSTVILLARSRSSRCWST